MKRKRVIDLLKKKSYRYSEMVRETGIAESTMDRIFKELKILGLVEKKVDGLWEWYLYRRTFSPIEYELLMKHSRHVILEGRMDMQAFEETSAYRVLRFYDKGVLKRDFPDFLGHLRTGYPELSVLFEKWKKLPETAKVSDAGGFEPLKEETETMENIVYQVGGQLSVIIMKVRNGIPLEGHCDFCPYMRFAIEG